MKLDVYDFESYLKHSFLYICSNSLLYSSASFHNFIHIELVYFLLQLFFIILLFLLELQQGFFFHFIVSLDIVCTYEGYWITWQLENNTYRLTYVLLIYLFILLSWNHYFSVHFSLAGVHCSVILSGMVNSWVKKKLQVIASLKFYCALNSEQEFDLEEISRFKLVCPQHLNILPIFLMHPILLMKRFYKIHSISL